MGGIFGRGSKGPSAAELQAMQEAAARAERDRLAKETAGAQAAQQKKMAQGSLPLGLLTKKLEKRSF
jgi:hypothetical protein